MYIVSLVRIMVEFWRWSLGNFFKCGKYNIGNLLKIFAPGGRVVRVCCLILHITLMGLLNCVIVDGHFYSDLS
jgi:hypothetical protein